MTLGLAAQPLQSRADLGEELRDRRELDEARSLPSTSHIAEATLIYAYSRRVDSPGATAACACGFDVVVASDSDEDLIAGVGAHNATPAHLSWRVRQAR